MSLKSSTTSSLISLYYITYLVKICVSKILLNFFWYVYIFHNVCSVVSTKQFHIIMASFWLN